MLKRTNITLISLTDSAASTKIQSIKNCKSIIASFKRTNHSSGNHVFKFEGSTDGGTTWFSLPLVKIIANTNAQHLTRVLSITLSSATEEWVAIEPLFLAPLTNIKVTATRTTDGKARVMIALLDEEV